MVIPYMAPSISKMIVTHDIKTDIATIKSLPNVSSKEVLELDTNTKYVMLNSDDNYITQDDTVLRYYNSVVIDPYTRKILSVGCSKGYILDTYKTMHEYADENIAAEEMVEGLFLQMFYDVRIKKWEISTRNSISGKYAYFRTPNEKCVTYREMLFDAMGLLGTERELEKWKGLSVLDKTKCYHFILQHPENHLVFNHSTPRLFYVGHCELHLEEKMNQVRYCLADRSLFANVEGVTVYYPAQLDKTQSGSTYDECMKTYISSFSTEMKMGLCFIHKVSGERTFILGEKYLELKTLRGTHPNIMYQYLCLRRVHKIKDFVHHFPQYKDMFWEFHKMYEALIVKMHSFYVSHFIQKEKHTIHKSFYYHICQMHQTIYKPSLQEPEKVIVRKPIVRKYLDNLEPGCVLHLLQHEKYKEENRI